MHHNDTVIELEDSDESSASENVPAIDEIVAEIKEKLEEAISELGQASDDAMMSEVRRPYMRRRLKAVTEAFSLAVMPVALMKQVAFYLKGLEIWFADNEEIEALKEQYEEMASTLYFERQVDSSDSGPTAISTEDNSDIFLNRDFVQNILRWIPAEQRPFYAGVSRIFKQVIAEMPYDGKYIYHRNYIFSTDFLNQERAQDRSLGLNNIANNKIIQAFFQDQKSLIEKQTASAVLSEENMIKNQGLRIFLIVGTVWSLLTLVLFFGSLFGDVINANKTSELPILRQNNITRGFLLAALASFFAEGFGLVLIFVLALGLAELRVREAENRVRSQFAGQATLFPPRNQPASDSDEAAELLTNKATDERSSGISLRRRSDDEI